MTSPTSTNIYRKHNSFVAIRHQAPPVEDATARIRALQAQLSSLGISTERKAVIAQACGELLGTVQSPAGTSPFQWHSYVIEEVSKLTDEELPRYLWYRYRYEIYPQRRLLDDVPPCLQIEPTSVCNYRCVFCYQTDAGFTKRTNGHMGMMSMELFRRVIDEAQGRCEAVTLASRGEPLLCRTIESMLAYLRGKFLALKLNTNASTLNERLCHAILEAEMNTVVFSAEAASEPAYSRLRVGGRLGHVLENVRRFQEIRKRHYPRSRTITRVSGVKVDGTPALEEMERFWSDLVDQVAFVAYNPWENVYERPVNDLTTPCSDLWRRMFVWWDGTVNPCDVDYRSALAVGNARKQTLGQLWRSELYERLRERHLSRQRSACLPCNRCTVV